ncbi:hypothetical protein H3146_07235 [Streptomyces sp. OF3]|uniref:Uncharacterized protein n=1 Tax=Streptomyces alkaliterrae TaxID=2213162 RepID=A0A7W3WIX9_9ACTN|nr:hypothetical protein [Streptomyces alkaliterrae]MBB1253163.1 hypothetical protein [Streptomyces alkaliterrae]
MPTTDAYGQGIKIAALTDAPNAETLAYDIVNALTPQSVMRFADAAARAAAITSPVNGMLTYLVAEQRIDARVGGSWVTIGSSVSTWTTIGLVSGYSHNGNSNGTLQYRRINLFGEPSIQLKGALNVTYSPGIPNSGTFTASALPVAARPSSLRTVVIPCSDVTSDRITLKLDAQTSGHLRIYGTNSTNNRPPWIGFNGVFYSL